MPADSGAEPSALQSGDVKHHLAPAVALRVRVRRQFASKGSQPSGPFDCQRASWRNTRISSRSLFFNCLYSCPPWPDLLECSHGFVNLAGHHCGDLLVAGGFVHPSFKHDSARHGLFYRGGNLRPGNWANTGRHRHGATRRGAIRADCEYRADFFVDTGGLFVGRSLDCPECNRYLPCHSRRRDTFLGQT